MAGYGAVPTNLEVEAQYAADGQWYRALITAQTATTVTVLYPDYNEYEILPLERVRAKQPQPQPGQPAATQPTLHAGAQPHHLPSDPARAAFANPAQWSAGAGWGSTVSSSAAGSTGITNRGPWAAR